MANSDHYEQSIIGVREAIQALSLPGILPDNIIDQEMGDDRELEGMLPGILVYPFGVEAYGGGWDQGEYVGYPVAVAIFDTRGPTRQSRATRLGWRRTMQGALLHQQFGTLYNTGQTDCTIENSPVIDIRAWFNAPNIFISQFIARVWWREIRP